jgi:DNA invertase Pin-like site-specific DNA recombinase
MSEKISERHLARKAILYVRQSSVQQIHENEESRRLQYAMQDKLREFGWQNIEVIDDDLGRSAGGAKERIGFQRMVAEISLGEVGAVAAREVSRFARNSREWQQLIEICRVVDTLLIDQDMIYDSRQANDRLLLGFKGTLNEYELDLLRLRSHEALRQKARRGELVGVPAIGYVKTEDGKIEKIPDLRVQQTIVLVFKKTFELGSVYRALIWFRENEVLMPRRSARHGGPVQWKKAHYLQLKHILKNPIYAGAYAYGRSSSVSRVRDGKLQRSVVGRSLEQCSILMKDHHEGYISWEQFERVQQMIAKNAQSRRGSGAAKNGSALLAGLLRCKRCGRRVTVSYGGAKNNYLRYYCRRGNAVNGDPICISFGGVDIEPRVAQLVRDVVRPAAIDAAILAGNQVGHTQDDLLNALCAELEAARYESDRAWKQFDGADPENRLVVDELERRWNEKLGRVQKLEERVRQQQSIHEKAQVPSRNIFVSLAEDLDAVWNDPRTDWRLKKRIVRTLIEEVVVDIDDDGRCIVLLIHWKGGLHSEIRVPKRRSGQWRSKAEGVDLVATIQALAL